MAPVGLLCIWLSSVACSQAQSPAAAQSPAPGASEPVATVGGAAITRADLDALVAPQIAKLDEQAHQIRRAQLDDLIAERLLEAEAKTRNLSPEALEKVEIVDKVVPLTQADIDAFVAANRARLPGDPATLMPQIRKYLTEQRQGVRREAFLDELRGRTKVEVLLKPPAVFRAAIDLTGTPSRGTSDAKVTVVEFSDFHCPFCKRVQPTLTQLLSKYPNDVKLVYKHMPLDQLHPQARRAAEASWCAQQQGKFWEYHDLLYSGGPDGSDPTLFALATRAGLDASAYQQCMASGKAAEVVQTHVDEGAKFGVSGTPGFFVNGRFLNGAMPLEAFVQVVEEELGR
ncbi:MAG: thioredoxin domain-containing protein [Vicinamibacteria bacterium]|nr:thioredoxin domain-containing protein [Vicinamibacteria bacterium]